MHAYDQIEYSNVALWFNKGQIQELVAIIVEQGMHVAWKETPRYFTLSVQTDGDKHSLTFKRKGKRYQLRDRYYKIKDQRFERILQHFIEQAKGHAVIKFFTGDQLVVQKIRYGEAFQIMKISGDKREVVFEKECFVTMDDVMIAFKRRDAEERIPVMRMEIDYELAVLQQALNKGDTESVERSQERLCELRHEMLLLEI
ncbi:hypothetical protein PP175_17105 [Aneurinibacillus sp. Ricciae_BoGa-3]|uniref:hypothetical protein n=1 Tax=Aneurinibacillus sp. Ricciae_BoGa-3 TaxID=3022697 RepID=UPI0023421EC0|nr:hypothetical protein [Aneurinibacillus sp. Ricciae_BoGa-3]WCK53117.1 hypothetical protein PP175_17105 [Aneurinibacillus sp. Ricciae_BoGa-3]